MAKTNLQAISRDLYTVDDIRYLLTCLNSGDPPFVKMSWREIARVLFDDQIDGVDLWGYATQDRPVVNREHRRLLLIGPTRSKRIVINPVDPMSAALSILNARDYDGSFLVSDDYIDRLSDLLSGVDRGE